ncbi:MAG: hypothetical protein KAI99_09945 [Cyclobacteriaceae bacterium]|nr:hypothetical protein [Cyclobacteriaceae bacterium]
MKKLIGFLAVFIGIGSTTLHAQFDYTIMELNDMVGQLKWNKNIHADNPGIKGSPYLYEEFQSGEVYYDKKYKVVQIPLQYNLYNDEFVYEYKNVTMAFANPGSIDKIVIGDEVFIYIEKDKQKKVSGFVKMWNDQYPTVLTKMNVDFLKKEQVQPFTEQKLDRFERTLDKHYLMKSQNEIEKISSVKKLIKSLGNHLSELSDFAKYEKISANDPEELTKLLEFYHGLD